jgi:hypothetical protein
MNFRAGVEHPGMRPAHERDRSPEVVLEHFDFEHEVFQQEGRVDVGVEELDGPFERWVEQMKELIARQAGTVEVLISLDAPMPDLDRPADRYIAERLTKGDTAEDIQTDVQAAYEALEERIMSFKMPVEDDKSP